MAKVANRRWLHGAAMRTGAGLVVLAVMLVNRPALSQDCDPNYDPCVPIASDVDCAGGKGNGPEYVSGPITVIGTDIYDLDRDGDGIACE
ncbi:excalibur calcium-binding domain-containing protein [Mesorhizobium sp. KR9-304]|uniref:excalibur calcium-binding domain-containing protein n=1 Tax=Mesorhizobium sp. KR9-304 TaxID=3156614 RepID=UPI0032B3CE9C